MTVANLSCLKKYLDHLWGGSLQCKKLLIILDSQWNSTSVTILNKVLSVALEYDADTEVKEMVKGDKNYPPNQLWKIETPNEEGFFNIIANLNNKVLSANKTSLVIDGKFPSLFFKYL